LISANLLLSQAVAFRVPLCDLQTLHQCLELVSVRFDVAAKRGELHRLRGAGISRLEVFEKLESSNCPGQVIV
jgi:hypothetical protein